MRRWTIIAPSNFFTHASGSSGNCCHHDTAGWPRALEKTSESSAARVRRPHGAGVAPPLDVDRARGFSLLEVMAATTVFVVAVTGLASLFLLSVHTTARARATT